MYFAAFPPFSGFFAVPSVLADSQLILAGDAFLRAAIWIFRHAGEAFDTAALAEGTGLSVGQAGDAVLYWQNLGYVRTDGQPLPAAAEEKTENNAAHVSEGAATAQQVQQSLFVQGAPTAAVVTVQNTDNKSHAAAADEKASEKKAAVTVKPTTLTNEQINARINESAEVRELLNEAQEKLGRCIGRADRSSLLLLHDYYGLPVEIILVICEFARTHGKAGAMNYIYTMGSDWSTREIDTIEAADEELRRLESSSAAWNELRKRCGIAALKPTAAQQKMLCVWMSDWKFSLEMIYLAYEEMTNHVTDSVSFPYMNKILSLWHKEGVSTPEKVSEREKKFREQKEKQAAEKAPSSPYNPKKKSAAGTQSSSKASYDIEKAEHEARTSVPVLRKREKR